MINYYQTFYDITPDIICDIYDINKEKYYDLLIENKIVDTELNPYEEFRGKVINHKGKICVSKKGISDIMKIFRENNIGIKPELDLTEDQKKYLQELIKQTLTILATLEKIKGEDPMLSIPMNARCARSWAEFYTAPERELKNVLANLNQDILEAAAIGKFYISFHNINYDTEVNLRKNVMKALSEAGFDVRELKERTYVFWTDDADKIDEIFEEELRSGRLNDATILTMRAVAGY